MVFSFDIDYKDISTELCEIGSKYDTSKSPLRSNNTDLINCRPYTIFYNDFFIKQRNEKLQLAEIGISNGGSLLMWSDFFSNSKIYGFEYNNKLIDNFNNKFNNPNIFLSEIDVRYQTKISKKFNNVNEKFDIIIDNSTHEFEDQIRLIKNIYNSLKPGGVIIIEDILKSYNENDYILKLNNYLDFFQEYFFITLDHSRKKYNDKDNNKLFVLIKNGEKIFDNSKKITIITPSCRPDNLIKTRESLNFNFIKEWIIVYDSSKVIKNTKLFLDDVNNDKISEYFHNSRGISGNPQRNFALKNIKNKDTYIYYLDDDNIIHPNFYKLLTIIGEEKLCTFNQKNMKSNNLDNILFGNNIEIDKIDTSMFLFFLKFNKLTQWDINRYNADGYYIKEIYESNKKNWIYINNELSYYNYLVDFI
jgi:SAM-dependent methyltransferase